MDSVNYYSEQEVAELLAEQSRRTSLEVALTLAQGHARTTKRLQIRWAVAFVLVLLVGIGAGIVGERQVVVVPCVRALDAYHDTISLVSQALDTNGSDTVSYTHLTLPTKRIV